MEVNVVYDYDNNNNNNNNNNKDDESKIGVVLPVCLHVLHVKAEISQLGSSRACGCKTSVGLLHKYK